MLKRGMPAEQKAGAGNGFLGQKGLFDYLLKPVDIGVVVERIEQAYLKKTGSGQKGKE